MSFKRGETDRIREPRTAGTPVFFGYLVEVAPDEYRPTADAAEATHVHAFDEMRGGIVVAPIGTDTSGVRTYRMGENTYLISSGV